MQHSRTWYVVADGGSARVLLRRDEPGAREAYDTHLEFTSANIHKLTRDLGAAAPGRDHESATVARHAVEPRVDLHKAAKRTFVEEVAAALNAAGAQKAFDHLVLVAPAHALADLERALETPNRIKIAGRLQKDLTHTPNGDLPTHLAGLAPV